MRAHPEAVAACSATKRSLAAAIRDVASYSDVKDPIVDLIMVVAEAWASETGWSASLEVDENRP